MHAYGADRCREVAGRRILHSRIPKGWTPRTPAALRHAEYPGTTVLWDDEYFEVVEAAPLDNGGVRYVLMPWRDDHTIRTLEAYDAESERQRAADYERAMQQRRASLAARFSGVLLGHLPHVVQNELQNRLGVSALRMTVLSTVPPLVLFGVCIYIESGAAIAQKPSPVPLWLLFLAALLTAESLVRFYVAMSQSRGVGSLLGTVAYLVWWAVSPRRAAMVRPWSARGDSVRFTPPSEERAAQDAFEIAAPFLTLLPAGQQRRFAATRGFDYRRHAFAVAWTILIFSLAGIWTSWANVASGEVPPVVSLIIAVALAAEQALRLVRLRHGPTGSILGLIVRPFTRRI